MSNENSNMLRVGPRITFSIFGCFLNEFLIKDKVTIHSAATHIGSTLLGSAILSSAFSRNRLSLQHI